MSWAVSLSPGSLARILMVCRVRCLTADTVYFLTQAPDSSKNQVPAGARAKISRA